MLALTIDLLRAFGLTSDDFVLRVSDREAWLAFLRAKGVDDSRAPDFLPIIDKIERLGHATLRQRPRIGKMDAPLLLWRATRMRPPPTVPTREIA